MTPRRYAQQGGVLTAAYEDYAKALASRALSRLNNHAASEDMVQDTFVKTWQYLVKKGKVNTMKSFLYHILDNLIVDEYRRRKAVSLDALLERGYEPASDGSERLVDSLDGAAALRLINRLPARYQKVLQLRYVEDFSLEEIAHATGQSRNAIAVQLHRGLSKLRMLCNGG